MLTALLLSTSIVWMRLLTILALTNKASSWGWCTLFTWTSVKTMSSGFGIMPFRGQVFVTCIMDWGKPLASWSNLSLTHQVIPTSFGPLNMVWTSPLMCKSSIHSLSLARFCLWGCALLATRFPSTGNLATTLDFAICYNTTLRTTLVHCALVAHRLTSLCQLAKTLGFAVLYNTTVE